MRFAVFAIALLLAFSAQAQKEGTWTVKDFRFSTGEVLPELSCTTPRSARRRTRPS